MHNADRSLRNDLVALEQHLAVAAATGRRSAWIERLRERVRTVRQRLEERPAAAGSAAARSPQRPAHRPYELAN